MYIISNLYKKITVSIKDNFFYVEKKVVGLRNNLFFNHRLNVRAKTHFIIKLTDKFEQPSQDWI